MDHQPTRGSQESRKKPRDSRTLARIPARNVGATVAILYLLAGILWIVVTDRWVNTTIFDLELEHLVEGTKGILFVSLSALLIYFLVEAFNRRVHRQAEELNAVFSSPEMSAIRFDEKGTIQSFTPCLTDLLAFSEEELQNKNLRDITHPEDWPAEAQLLSRFREKQIDGATHELRLRRKNGEYIWVEQMMRAFKDDVPLSFVSTIQWIDDRIEAEDRLKEALREKEALINNTDDLIWSLDREMRLVSFNQPYEEAILKFSGLQPEKGAKGILTEFGQESAGRWRGYYQRVLQGETFTVEEENRSQFGKDISEILLSPIFEGREIVGISCIARDITALKQTEKELSERAERLQTAQKLAQMGDWTYDPETNTVTWSDMLFQIFERDPARGAVSLEDLLKSNLFPEDASKLREAVDRALSQGISYDFGLTFILENGKQKQVRCIGVPYREGDKTWKLRGIVQDVTEDAKLREALKLHQEQLQVVVGNIPGVIFQYRRDPEGNDLMTYVSEGTEDLWGLTSVEVVTNNQRVWELFHPDDIQAVQESIRESAETLDRWYALWRVHHPASGLRWQEGFGLPRRLADGSTVWNSIIIDVTERVEMETRLKEHEEYWHLLSQHASDGIVACDAEGRLVLFNETARSWVGEMDPSLDPGEWPEAYGLHTLEGSRCLREDEVDLVRALKGEDVRNARYTIRIKGQPTRFIESNGGPLYDGKGDQIGAMIIVRDISDRYRLEFEVTNAVIEASEQERARIAAELHDSVTQELSIVSLNLNNFKVENPETAASERISRAQKHLLKAIAQTRDISHRIMPGTVKDLGLIGALSELADEVERASDLRIEFEYNREVRLAESMELDIFRIVQESLNNVLKHAQASLVRIRLVFTREWLELSVSDNGIGFRATDPKNENLGIGLRTMRNRARKWEGSFHIDSDNGETIVFVKVPLKAIA